MASFILPIISGLAGLFGGQSTKQSTTNSTNTQSQNGQNSSSTTPNLSPLQQQLSNMFGGQAQNLANSDTDLSGYTNSGLKGINTSSNMASKTIANNLASRGLSFSPAAATQQTANENNRLNQSQQFLSQIPLLQRQIQQQNIQGLEGAFSALPTGVSSTGTSSATGTSSGNSTTVGSTPGGALPGALAGFGAGLAAPSAIPGQGSNLNAILKTLGY